MMMCICLIFLPIEYVIPKHEYGIRIRHQSDCPSSSTNEDITVDILQLLSQEFGIHALGRSQTYAAMSCDQIKALNPASKDGFYWIESENSMEQVLCDF